jgi:excisionase family DNA binding protein
MTGKKQVMLEDDYMNCEEAARYLGRTQGALRNLVHRRIIPYRKPAGRLMFLRSELRRWVLEAPGISYDELTKQ